MLDIHPKVKYNELEQLYDYNKRVIRAQADIDFRFCIAMYPEDKQKEVPYPMSRKIRSSCPSSNG